MRISVSAFARMSIAPVAAPVASGALDLLLLDMSRMVVDVGMDVGMGFLQLPQ